MSSRVWKSSPPAPSYRAVVPDSVIAEMAGYCAKARKRETGGILIGHYSDDHQTAFVREITDKPRDSAFTWLSFRRGTDGLRRLLEERWAEGLYYLGEWHFHPGGSPLPSGQDRESMRDIARDPAYACEVPLLMIMGGKPPNQGSLHISVYPAGKADVILSPDESQS